MGEVKEKQAFVLPEKIVHIKFISRKIGMAAGDHITKDHVISGGMLNSATKRFQAPLKKQGGIFNVLTNAEKETLERITGLDLSVYGDFWKDFFVTLKKENNILDLSDAMDYISYKVLLFQKDDIAPNWKVRYKVPTYQFVITDESEETTEKLTKLNSTKQAFKMFGKIEDDRDLMVGVLKLISNKPVALESKLDWLQTKVGEYVEKAPSEFVALLEDPSFYTRILINKAVDLGVIKKNGHKYATVDGLDLCEAGETPNFTNAVNYLDNPKHQDVLSLIQAKMSNAE